jgi:hypothetical protein
MRPILISGEANSGKSLLAAMLERELGYRTANIGNLLAERLERELAIVPRDRSTIGATYFRHFGLDDYVATLVRELASGVVLDGIRIAPAVAPLRRVCPRLFHVHRLRIIGPPRMREPYTEDIEKLAELADVVETRPRYLSDRCTPEILTVRLLEEVVARLREMPVVPSLA